MPGLLVIVHSFFLTSALDGTKSCLSRKQVRGSDTQEELWQVWGMRRSSRGADSRLGIKGFPQCPFKETRGLVLTRAGMDRTKWPSSDYLLWVDNQFGLLCPSVFALIRWITLTTFPAHSTSLETHLELNPPSSNRIRNELRNEFLHCSSRLWRGSWFLNPQVSFKRQNVMYRVGHSEEAKCLSMILFFLSFFFCWSPSAA